VDRQGADVRNPQELFACITGGDERICVVSSDETRYSSVVAEQSRVERLDLSVVADGNQKHICPFEEYVCCYKRDYSKNLTGNSAIDGHNDDIDKA